MTEVEKLLAAGEMLHVSQTVKRWENEKIVSASEGPYHICKCGRLAIPGAYHCTSCAP